MNPVDSKLSSRLNIHQRIIDENSLFGRNLITLHQKLKYRRVGFNHMLLPGKDIAVHQFKKIQLVLPLVVDMLRPVGEGKDADALTLELLHPGNRIGKLPDTLAQIFIYLPDLLLIFRSRGDEIADLLLFRLKSLVVLHPGRTQEHRLLHSPICFFFRHNTPEILLPAIAGQHSADIKNHCINHMTAQLIFCK